MAVLDRPLPGAGNTPVDVPIVCVVTRFGLRRPHHLLSTYLDYRRVVRDALASRTPGLLRTAFLVEGPSACFSVSIWRDADAIPVFGTNVREHTVAGNRVFGRLAVGQNGLAEIWSTKWRLVSVSNNLNWEDFDLRRVLQTSRSPLDLGHNV
jgi:hypothetical protein